MMLAIQRSSSCEYPLGYEPTFPPHALLLDHEKAHGDIFVSLMLSGRLTGWDRAERPQLRDDGKFYIDDDLYYLEVEMENHGIDRLAEKVARYKKHFRESQESFHVLFVMKQSLDKILKVFESERTTPHYRACLLDELVASPMTASLHHLGGKRPSKKSSKRHSKHVLNAYPGPICKNIIIHRDTGITLPDYCLFCLVLPSAQSRLP